MPQDDIPQPAASSANEWARLASAISAQRRQLGLTQEDLVERGGPSAQTVRALENGTPADYRPSTWMKVDRALEWPRGRARQLLRGEHVEDELPQQFTDEGTQNPLRRTTEFIRFNDEHTAEEVAFYLVDRLDRLRRSDPGNPRNAAILAVVNAVHGFLHGRPESADVPSLDETRAPRTRPAVEGPPIRVRFKTADAPAAPATEDDRRAQQGG